MGRFNNPVIMVKKSKKGKKKAKKLSPEEEKQQMFEVLVVKTGLSKDEVEKLHEEFIAENPEGVINMEKYVSSHKNTMMAESLFRVFDEDKSGTLSFDEYLQASQVTDLETAEDKLSWIFTAFDSDGGGTIDYDEITDICRGLFRLAGIEEDEDLLASCVTDVRATIDGDGDGDISKEEFVTNAMQSKFIANLLTKQHYND